MNEYTITIQEFRRNLPQVLREIAAGRLYTVIAHSKPVVRLGNVTKRSAPVTEPGKTQGQLIVEAAARARASAKGRLDPNKSIKELYHEMLDEDYAEFTKRLNAK